MTSFVQNYTFVYEFFHELHVFNHWSLKKRSYPSKNALPSPLPAQYNVFKKLGEISGSSFQHCMFGAGEVR